MNYPIINTISDLLNECKKHDEFALYGCGNVGKIVLSYLEAFGFGCRVKKIYVSCKQDEPFIYGRKIFCATDEHIDEFVLVSTSEIYHKEIVDLLNKQSGCHFAVISDALVSEIRVFEYSKEAKNNIAKLNNEIDWLKRALYKSTPLSQLQFSVDITEHCNLNCAGCNHFAPIAEEEFLDIDNFKNDIERLGILAHGDAYRIELMGGEPLLNPRAIEYAMIARKSFPKARIAFLSNGVLVKRLPDVFFEQCKKYDISIDLSPYPIDVDYDELLKFIRSKGLVGSKFQTGENYRIWKKWVFDLEPNYPGSLGTENWFNCIQANNCMNLRNGKLSCVTVQKARHFIKYFPDHTKHMYFSDRDYIDIYEIGDIREIFDFFSRPLPFCKYCKTRETQIIQWGVSKKNIEEWT